MRWWLVMMLAAPAAAEPLVDVDERVTCRALHAAEAAGCPRHVVRRGDRIDVSRIEFEIAKPMIRPAGLVIVRELAAYLNAHSELARIEIQGHSGFEETYGMRLSARRAEAVKQALIAHGVERERLDAKGYGEDRPIVVPRTAADRRRNTRIEFRIRER